MKNIFLLCAMIIISGAFLSAQTLQTEDYDDGKILAYIQNDSKPVRIGYKNYNVRAGKFIIENIFNGEIEVRYCFKSAAVDSDYKIVNEKITYRTVTLRAGGSKTETGVESRGSNGHFVDSFSVTGVRVKSVSALQSILRPNNGRYSPRAGSTARGNSAAEENAAPVPPWARGTWYISASRTGGKFAEITGSQFISVSAFDCTKAEEGVVWFGGDTIMVTRSNSPDEIFLAVRAKSGNSFTTLYR